MARALFAYHLTHHFGPFNLDSYYTNDDAPKSDDIIYVISGNNSESPPGVDYSLEGKFRVARRDIGPFRLRDLKGDHREFRYRLSMSPIQVPDAPIRLSMADWYSREEVHRYFSSGQNFNPLPIDPDYRRRFDALLAGFGQSSMEELREDLAELQRSVPDVTEREVLAKARIGQGQYRINVASLWDIGEVCPLTGIDVPELLVASHIKPWRDADIWERLDGRNGLVLATHVDKLFDRHLLSFRVDGDDFRCDLHPRVQRVAVTLGVKAGLRLNSARLGLSDHRKVSDYLKAHHGRFVERKRRDSPTASH